LLAGVGVVPACPKVLYNLKTDVFEVDLLIVITSVPFPTYQVLPFASTRSGTKFEYLFDFPSVFHYFTWLFILTTREVR